MEEKIFYESMPDGQRMVLLGAFGFFFVAAIIVSYFTNMLAIGIVMSLIIFTILFFTSKAKSNKLKIGSNGIVTVPSHAVIVDNKMNYFYVQPVGSTESGFIDEIHYVFSLSSIKDIKVASSVERADLIKKRTGWHLGLLPEISVAKNIDKCILITFKEPLKLHNNAFAQKILDTFKADTAAPIGKMYISVDNPYDLVNTIKNK